LIRSATRKRNAGITKMPNITISMQPGLKGCKLRKSIHALSPVITRNRVQRRHVRVLKTLFFAQSIASGEKIANTFSVGVNAKGENAT
jgi:hypothetical protein